jgi:hypothetical protein
MKLHLGSVHKNKVVFTLMKIVNLHPENLMKYVRLLSYYQTWELNTIGPPQFSDESKKIF